MIRAAKNGCSSEIKFKGRKVYHDWKHSSIPKSHLGENLNKIEFLKENLVDESHLPAIEKLMIDWELYDKYFINGFGRLTSWASRVTGKFDFEYIDQLLVDGTIKSISNN